MREDRAFAKGGNDSVKLGQPKKEYDSATLGRREVLFIKKIVYM